MLDQIRRDIQARLQDLLDEVDKLHRALAALTSHESEPDRGDHAARVAGSAPAGESVAKSTGATVGPTPRTSGEKPADAAATAAARPRNVQGATKAAVLAVLADGSAMTAGEIAAATGLGRATVSTTLSKLASSGEIAKAARGYQLGRESDSTRKPARPRPSASTVGRESDGTRKPARPRPSASTVATSPSPPAAEPLAAEPLAGESPAVDPARGAPRPDPGATNHAVLAAFARGSAMTADEVATATGLAREKVSSTLSALAKAGELRNAARGYQLASVAAAQRFYFQIEDDATPRVVVANLPELEAAIAACGPGVLRQHCAEHDFSRWVAGVLHNEPLAADIAAAEARLSADSPTETVDYVRLGLIAAL